MSLLKALRDEADAEGLIAAFRAAVQADGWLPREEVGAAPKYDGAVLVASPEGLWLAMGDFGSARMETDVPVGIGSGGAFAQGAALALRRRGCSASSSLSEAVLVASKCDVNTGGQTIIANSAGLWEVFS